MTHLSSENTGKFGKICLEIHSKIMKTREKSKMTKFWKSFARKGRKYNELILVIIIMINKHKSICFLLFDAFNISSTESFRYDFSK